jgi:diacylglycerol kinase family enzyme
VNAARPVSVIVNRSSGSAAAAQPALEAALARASIDATVTIVGGAEIQGAAERAAASGHTLVAAGGDGTVSTIASVAIEHHRTFGVIPLGTLNHFARDAGIPADLDAAVDVLTSGRVVPLDAGTLNGRIFLNNASLGFYARIVRERSAEQRRGRRKWFGFAIGLARAWIDYEAMTVRLTVDGTNLVRRTPFVFIGNGEYEAEGLDTGQRCSADALQRGELSIYIAPECGRFELLGLSIRALTRTLTPHVKLESFRAAHVVVDTAMRHPAAALDGELVSTAATLECRVMPAVLQTLLPAATSTVTRASAMQDDTRGGTDT